MGHTVSGQGYQVDVDVLDGAARSMRELAADQDQFELRGLCGEPEVYGHQGLHDGLADACDKLSNTLDNLASTVEDLAGGLEKSAALYRESEQANAQKLQGGGGDPGMALEQQARQDSAARRSASAR